MEKLTLKPSVRLWQAIRSATVFVNAEALWATVWLRGETKWNKDHLMPTSCANPPEGIRPVPVVN